MRGAFVVQFRELTQAGQLEGVVEEVDTGKQAKFLSENELIGFLRECFAETQQKRHQKGKERMNVNTIVNEPTDSIPEITSIVHDLRNPLTAIRIGAETIIASRFSEPRIHGIAANVYRASVHMQELLEELLTRYRWMDRGVQSTDLRDLVISAVRKIAFVAECQSVQIVQNVPERMMIAADRQRIQRVFVNLFVNALDVMPNGGAIRISAIRKGHSVLIKVRDTGPGIRAEIRNRLFQPFATAGKTNGLGLGLALSRQAVIDDGGQIWVESNGPGACFALLLPRHHDVTA